MKVFIGRFPKNGGERKVRVEISDHDIWSLDHTLALIILPALKKFKENQMGHPCGLRPDPTGLPETGCGNCGCEQEWNVILDKMLYSFEHIVDDRIMVYSTEEYKESQKKIQEGLELFGKYFQSLWT